MYELYYLVDQEDSIDGAKQLIAVFDDIQSCHDMAQQASMAHYSIEAVKSYGDEVIFII